MKALVYWTSVLCISLVCATGILYQMPQIVAFLGMQAQQTASQPAAPAVPAAEEVPARLTTTPQQSVVPTTVTPGLFTLAGIPQPTTYPNPVSIIRKRGHMLAYDEVFNNPAWVAYRVTLDKWHEEHKRPSSFKTDYDTKARVTHKHYTRSGYDRGHMAPNEAVSESYGRQAQLDTFLMSNVVPQKPNLNQGPWRLFEEWVVDQAKEEDTLWVVTGPIYDPDQTSYLPNTAIRIPTAFWKVVIDQQAGGLRVYGMIMEQGVARRSDRHSFQTTIDEIEARSGWDVLSELDDDIENALEATQVEWR